jgi:hypothetical protein
VGWKGLPDTNALDYLPFHEEKSFKTMTHGVNVINVFSLSLTLLIKKLACLFFSYLIFAAKALE